MFESWKLNFICMFPSVNHCVRALTFYSFGLVIRLKIPGHCGIDSCRKLKLLDRNPFVLLVGNHPFPCADRHNRNARPCGEKGTIRRPQDTPEAGSFPVTD